jgi:hypothetical protein
LLSRGSIVSFLTCCALNIISWGCLISLDRMSICHGITKAGTFQTARTCSPERLTINSCDLLRTQQYLLGCLISLDRMSICHGITKAGTFQTARTSSSERLTINSCPASIVNIDSLDLQECSAVGRLGKRVKNICLVEEGQVCSTSRQQTQPEALFELSFQSTAMGHTSPQCPTYHSMTFMHTVPCIGVAVCRRALHTRCSCVPLKYQWFSFSNYNNLVTVGQNLVCMQGT